MDRKDFIKTCGFACAGGAFFTTLLQSCASTNYVAKTSEDKNRLVVKKTEFIKTEKNKTVQRQYVLLRPEKYPFPIALYQLGENEYSALLLQCTHKGCELKPQGSNLICPCHGSEFTNKGVVQNPPAETNLQSFKTTTDNENIYIQL